MECLSTFALTVLVSLMAPLLLFSQMVHSVSMRGERWSAPCRGSDDAFSSIWIMELLRHGDSDPVVAHKLWLEANDIITIATRIRNLYAQHRIQSDDLKSYLDENVTISGFPDVRALSPNTNLLERLREDYRRASVVAVFMQQIMRDEQVSNLSPNYMMHFQMLEAQLYPFLCQLHIAITDRTSSPITHVTSDVMVDSDRNVSNTGMRYCRDYRILKDTVRLMTSIQADYDNIRQNENLPVVRSVEKKSVLTS